MTAICFVIVHISWSYSVYLIVGMSWAVGIIMGVEYFMRPESPLVSMERERQRLIMQRQQYYHALAHKDRDNAAYYLALMHLQSIGVEFEQADVSL